jgi:hypothetical protein
MQTKRGFALTGGKRVVNSFALPYARDTDFWGNVISDLIDLSETHRLLIGVCRRLPG